MKQRQKIYRDITRTEIQVNGRTKVKLNEHEKQLSSVITKQNVQPFGIDWMNEQNMKLIFTMIKIATNGSKS